MFDASVLAGPGLVLRWYNMADFGDQTVVVKNQITKIDECFKKLCYTDTNVETLGYVGLPLDNVWNPLDETFGSQSFAQQLQTMWNNSDCIYTVWCEIGFINAIIDTTLNWVQDKNPLLKEKIENNCQLLQNTLSAYANQIHEQIDHLHCDSET